MSDRPSSLRVFLAELKRRRVFRVAIVYAAVGFVIWQAAEIAVPGLNLPAWALTLVILLTVLGFPIALVLAWALEITPEGVRRTEPAAVESGPSGAVEPVPADALGVAQKSIAVLPFTNLSADPENEYFSDGMTEEIINALTQLRDLRVAARTSSFAFKGESPNLGEVGSKLRVATVLEGSVRKAGDRLRITAQLIDVASGYHLWSEQYDRELMDVFAIQEEITLAIVEKLKVELFGAEEKDLVRQHTENPEAHSLYLKGRSYFLKFTLPDCQLAIASYQQAINLDPDYAKAHEGLARTYTMVGGAGPLHLLPPREAYPLAKAAITKALELDDRLPEAHTTLGVVRSGFEWDCAGAERAFKRALELNPNDPDSHLWYAWHLWFVTDRFDEAISCLRTASALDPLAPLHQSSIGLVHFCARRYSEAVQQLQRVLEVHPRFFHALLHLGDTYVAMGMYEEAEAAYQKTLAIIGTGPLMCTNLCVLYAAWNKVDEAKKHQRELLALSERTHVPPAFVSWSYAVLGDHDEAFAWLEKAYEERDPQVRVLVWPWFDPLRADPRFLALRKKLGLEL
jgi:TolB-like protein/Flp pilus assembly protein TadD